MTTTLTTEPVATVLAGFDENTLASRFFARSVAGDSTADRAIRSSSTGDSAAVIRPDGVTDRWMLIETDLPLQEWTRANYK